MTIYKKQEKNTKTVIEKLGAVLTASQSFSTFPLKIFNDTFWYILLSLSSQSLLEASMCVSKVKN